MINFVILIANIFGVQMLPEEAQAIMAKILLVVFGTIMLCFSKVRASEVASLVSIFSHSHKVVFIAQNK